MDKFLIRKDVYDKLIEKGYGKKDLSKLTKKQVTDKNGHKRTVYVRNSEQPAAQNQPKAQDELTPEKKARYEEMLEKVKAGSDENALFVGSKGMLNKKDAIAYLEGKLGKKSVSSAAQGHLESDTPQNTDITKEDEERFGKQALSGLSGKREIDNFLHGSEPTPGSIMKNQQQKIMEENDNKVIIKRKYGMISLYGAKTGDHIADFQTEKARLDFMKENNLSKPDSNNTSPEIKGGEKTIDRWKELYENKKPTQDDMKEISFKDKVEEWKSKGLDNRAAHAKVAIDEIIEQIRATPDTDEKKLDELRDLMTDVQLNGLNSKYIKDKLQEEKKSENSEKIKAKEEYMNEVSSWQKRGLPRDAAFAKVALDKIVEEIKNTPKDNVQKLEELDDMFRDVQLNNTRSKYIQNILNIE